MVVPSGPPRSQLRSWATACRFNVGGNAIVRDYFTAERNVLVHVKSNPNRVTSEADAMRDAVRVVPIQISIIQRLAPR